MYRVKEDITKEVEYKPDLFGKGRNTVGVIGRHKERKECRGGKKAQRILLDHCGCCAELEGYKNMKVYDGENKKLKWYWRPPKKFIR